MRLGASLISNNFQTIFLLLLFFTNAFYGLKDTITRNILAENE